MSWRCSGKNNTQLITNLYNHNLIKSPRLVKAFLNVDRADFCPEDPYVDMPQQIGFGATISAPHMHANAAEGLIEYLKPGCKVLDIGSGSACLTALFAHLVSPGGQVIGLEHIPQLCDLSITNLNKNKIHRQMLADETIKIICEDGRLGYPEEAPYDAIHVGAAAQGGMPQSLIDQLKAPGTMFIPVEEGYSQHIWQVDKDAKGKVKKKRTYGVMYVPLTDAKTYSE